MAKRYMMMKTTSDKSFGALIDMISRCEKIAIILHLSPDGDAMGSGLALCLALEKLSKRVIVVCQDIVPHMYSFMAHSDKVILPQDAPWTPDLAIAVDVADKERMGSAAAFFDSAAFSACVDHHATNAEMFAQLAFVDPEKGATCIMIHNLIVELGVPMDRDIAQSIYVGIVTDTGNFNYSNTTPEALSVVAGLLDAHDIDIVYFTRMLFRLRRPQRLKLTARALESLEFYLDGKISVMSLSKADYEETGAQLDETESIVNLGMDCEGVVLAILAYESPTGVKFSFRSQEPFDVAELAASMGGGGHARASGCSLDMSLDDAVKYVVSKTKELLSR